ncbi:MAG: hypothetical protein ACP5G7_09995 [Anaerolineae bacterium]
MNTKRLRGRGTRLVLGAALACLVASGCEGWFRSETATPEAPPAVTAEATAEPTALPEATPTVAPSTEEPTMPVPTSENAYPYPVDLPEPGDLPEYPEAYPSD